MEGGLLRCLHAFLAFVVCVFVDILEGVSQAWSWWQQVVCDVGLDVYNYTCARPFVVGDVTKISALHSKTRSCRTYMTRLVVALLVWIWLLQSLELASMFRSLNGVPRVSLHATRNGSASCRAQGNWLPGLARRCIITLHADEGSRRLKSLRVSIWNGKRLCCRDPSEGTLPPSSMNQYVDHPSTKFDAASKHHVLLPPNHDLSRVAVVSRPSLHRVWSN